MSTTVKRDFFDYDGFVGKFAPRKTTDDCYTPIVVYEAILGWAREAFAIPPGTPILRPFRPGGDYAREDVPPGAVVIDNPPFSILAQILRHYHAIGARYFLFAPALTSAKYADRACVIFPGVSITYANGANVNTCFLTNLRPDLRIILAPDLGARIRAATPKPPALPVYALPPNVLNGARLQTLAARGVAIRLPVGACVPIDNLTSMRREGKSLFGGGVLIGEKTAAQAAQAAQTAAQAAQTAQTAAQAAQTAQTAAQAAQTAHYGLDSQEREAATRCDHVSAVFGPLTQTEEAQ